MGNYLIDIILLFALESLIVINLTLYWKKILLGGFMASTIISSMVFAVIGQLFFGAVMFPAIVYIGSSCIVVFSLGNRSHKDINIGIAILAFIVSIIVSMAISSWFIIIPQLLTVSVAFTLTHLLTRKNKKPFMP